MSPSKTTETRSSTAAHTPGPWRSHGAGGEIHGDSRVVATMTWCSGMQNEDEANARLIAAAPDLLDNLIALKKFAAAFGAFRDDFGQGVEDCVNRAIAKATEPPK